MPKWRVGGTVVGSTYIDEYEAPTWQEAVALATKDASVSLCHQCSREISDPEIESFWAENTETDELFHTKDSTAEAAVLMTRWNRLREEIELRAQESRDSGRKCAMRAYIDIIDAMRALEEKTND